MEEKIRGFLKERFPEAVLKEEEFRGDLSFFIKPEALVDICQALLESTDLDVKYLCDITTVDWLGHESESEGRFEMVYNLYSLSGKYRFFLKARISGNNPKIATLCDLWPSANWLEREVWDLFGITFEGHPDLTRILLPDEFEGYPLRKDHELHYEQPMFSWNKDDPPEVIK
ncbi:MAG TPA: NADH-quinone oxidoreductase subunit C [candidate division Zixibacteria bacterium]|nr:NADH-quinone oxidoreductase subunit C [candidate division Zixibacteria bacterium]